MPVRARGDVAVIGRFVVLVILLNVASHLGRIGVGMVAVTCQCRLHMVGAVSMVARRRRALDRGDQQRKRRHGGHGKAQDGAAHPIQHAESIAL